MSTAYVDASALIAIALNEPAGPETARRLEAFSSFVSSNLLEAEVRAVFAREGRAFEPQIVVDVDWILPARPLTPELAAVLEVGYLKGADLWHVATALYATEEMDRITFVTLDRRQESVAAALGFPT